MSSAATTAPVWLQPVLRTDATLDLADALTTKGLLQLLLRGLSGSTPEEIKHVPLNVMAVSGLSHFIAKR